ncbi:MAG: cell division protein ZapA [Rhodospirillales bacterium]|nr:cell division protein ZapA [Rhodospirillales bacterium]
MAQVTVRINGYAYTVGCKDGEEQHLLSMAAQVESRIDSIKTSAGQSGEARMLVMAALLMADELFEMDKALKAGGGGGVRPDGRLGKRLGKLARRAEELAGSLEQP